MRPSLLLLALGLGLLTPAGPAAAQSPGATRTIVNPDPQTSSFFGGALAPIGDVNNDGKPDLLVGAPQQTVDGVVRAGRAFVFSGRPTAEVLLTFDTPNPEQDGRFGRYLSSAGDVNADGRDDVLVAADMEGGTWQDGRVYVFSGADGALLRTYTSPSPSEITWFGSAVAVLDDVDFDGVRDHLIGARFSDDDGTNPAQPGRAYVFSGATGALLRTHAPENSGVLTDFGGAVANVGDVNRDTIDDYAVGAPREPGAAGDGTGRLYVFDGWQGHLLYTVVPPAPRTYGGFGGTISPLGDVTGDARADFAVGDGGGVAGGVPNVGRVYVINGANGQVVRTVEAPSPQEGGGFGGTVVAAGDVDGDRTPDLYATANVGPTGNVKRRGYLISGATGAVIVPVLPPYDETDTSFGSSFAALGDLNGDGQAEFAVGSGFETWENQSRVGVVHRLGTRDFGTVHVEGAQGWRLMAGSGPLQPFDRLLGPIWTQGVPGADISTSDPSVFQYDEAVAGPRAGGFAPIASQAAPMEVGRGYAVYVFEDDDPFTPGTQGGFPKTLDPWGYETGGIVTFPVAYTPSAAGLAEDGWNLVGNPFDAFLDWDVNGWTKANVDNVIYVWDAASGQYHTWNGTAGSHGSGLIEAYTGFWVKASGTPSLVSSLFARSNGPVRPEAARQGGAAVIGLRAEATLGGRTAAGQAFVQLGGGQPGQDALDAYELQPLAPTYLALFARGAGNVALDITALPEAAGTVEVPLDVQAVADGAPTGAAVTLTWPELRDVPAAWRLTLLDTATGATVDLRGQSSYTFTVGAQGVGPQGVAAPGAGALAGGPPSPTPLDAGGDAVTSGRLVLRVETGVTAGESGAPTGALALDAPAPNPARDAARLGFTLPAAGRARLAVYDVLGREVAVVHDAEASAGRTEAVLDASGLAPGLYVVRLEAGGQTAVRTLTLAR